MSPPALISAYSKIWARNVIDHWRFTIMRQLLITRHSIWLYKSLCKLSEHIYLETLLHYHVFSRLLILLLIQTLKSFLQIVCTFNHQQLSIPRLEIQALSGSWAVLYFGRKLAKSNLEETYSIIFSVVNDFSCGIKLNKIFFYWCTLER